MDFPEFFWREPGVFGLVKELKCTLFNKLPTCRGAWKPHPALIGCF